MRPYVPLWCKSNFSFLEGASHPEELIETAHALGLPAIALTDRDGVYGVVEAHVKGKEIGIRPILGAEITHDDDHTLLLLASTLDGYKNLCRLITKGRLHDEKEGRARKEMGPLDLKEVCAHAEGLIALWGGRRSRLVEPRDPKTEATQLKEAFGDRLYAMAARHHREREVEEERRLRQRAEHYQLPVVAASEVLYHTRARRPLQDILTCIRHRTSIAAIGRKTSPNAEHDLRSAMSMATLFADDPASLARTLEVADRTRFSLDEIRYRYPAERLPDGSSTDEWLRTLTFDGARFRYGDDLPEDVTRQLEKELTLIVELDYGGYFLTMFEIVEFCRREGILCQGRGSAANSAVCYCLRITAIDPVRMGLLFERFLSRERAEPPDIDLDIEHERREEVIQFVYQKYGRDRAAMVANVVRYRARSAVREVGKALGLNAPLLDRLAKILPHHGEVSPELLTQAGLSIDTTVHAHLIELTNEILDFPRHLSIHPGGFLLGHEPVHNIVPIEYGTMPGRTVIQWNKDDIENLNLFKVDLLGLGALTQLDLAFRMLKHHRDVDLSMATIPADDPDTFSMIQQGNTVGVFQIESRAQMAMLPRLRPENFYDLVIEVSIVRPGPISGGMVHPYLRRRHGEEEVIYPHPCLEPVLKKTLGVPLFQEQVMRLAVVAADYTPGEADQLRRDMAAWRRSGRIEKHRDRLIRRMWQKGIEREFAERVFDQIRGFGEYGFPESHAASFALIAYATAWLRCHYPAEFTASLLNAQPMGFYSVATLVEDARRQGVEVVPVSVTQSDWDCTLEEREERIDVGDARAKDRFRVRMGLRYVKGFHEAEWRKLEQGRRNGGPFRSIEDFTRRTHLRDESFQRLAECGALQEIVEDRRTALWAIQGPAREHQSPLPVAGEEVAPWFAPLDSLETILWDYRTTHHSPRGHPLEPLRSQLRERNLHDAASLRSARDGTRVSYAGLVICRQRPGTAKGVVFMTLEDETGFVNLVIWQQTFARFELLLKTTSFLGVTGRMQIEKGVAHLIADHFWTPPNTLRPATTQSRDFH